MKTMNKPVIMIDFGGVYFTSASSKFSLIYAKKFGISAKEIDNALLGKNWKHWIVHAEGKRDEKTYWEGVTKRLNLPDRKIQQLRKGWYSYPTPQKGMPQLVRKLRKKYRVVALSSIIVGWIEFMEKRYKLSERFHECHYTYDHGYDKPKVKFFLSAAKKMHLKPEDCIVIDDNRKFLAGVRKTGARTIAFRDAGSLKLKLRQMGVEI